MLWGGLMAVWGGLEVVWGGLVEVWGGLGCFNGPFEMCLCQQGPGMLLGL